MRVLCDTPCGSRSYAAIVRRTITAMSFYVANGLGDYIDNPTVEEMRDFLAQVDVTDEEHGAAWLSVASGHTLEWSDAVLVFTVPGSDPTSQHIRKVSRERALSLWVALATGDVAAVERSEWQPGNGFVLDLAREEKMRAWQLDQDRKFYQLLGNERADVP